MGGPSDSASLRKRASSTSSGAGVTSREGAHTHTNGHAVAAPPPAPPTHAYEFGGPIGTGLIMIISHVLLYYMYACLELKNGAVWLPADAQEALAGARTVLAKATPTWEAAGWYFGFIGVEALFAYTLPGLTLRGRPDETGQALIYRCNALLAWWASLALVAALHFSGTLPLQRIYDQLGAFMSVSVLFGDGLSVWLYVYTHRLTHTSTRMTGNTVYDFFMGAVLHPRVGSLDIKMFAELRVSWFLLFLLTASAAAAQVQASPTHTLTPSMTVMLLAHFLYANATAKGEHYVPPTWDITYEKFGWMLCFWNFAGVPFLYCFQSAFIARNVALVEAQVGQGTSAVLLLVLFAAYYVWDTSQSQKNHFRLQFSGSSVERWTFPYLPWQVLDNPSYIATARGTPLLTDGWWRYARKIHYTMDIIMAAVWGASCGFTHFLPYFYVVFFTIMIVHRYGRDYERCARNYGADWERYVKQVPYAFIPGIL